MAPNVLVPHCNTCNVRKVLDMRCSGCQIVRYCSKEHQTSDWSTHRSICNQIKRSRQNMNREETTLRNSPGNMLTLPNPFETGVGHFWGLTETRDYMRARMAFVENMVKLDTHDSVVSSLEHLLDMLRLCHSDNIGVRYIIPALYLRLNRDQDCYDFVKWWVAVLAGSNYDFGDMDLPYLNLEDEDVFEGVGLFEEKYVSSSLVVPLILLKFRVLLDLRDVIASSILHTTETLNYDTVRLIQNNLTTRSPIWSARPQLLAPEGLQGKAELLRKQTDDLFTAIDNANKWFWKALLNHEKYMDMTPEYYSDGSEEEMIMMVQNNARSWLETEGAMDWVQERINEKRG